MGRIRVLSDSLINRIAAGEVVERPASVLKELVENALDADAKSIDVRLRAGGKQSIRVLDDGSGMDRDDALLAVERHATSKLTSAGDLDRIHTLGFRGEALASIASISRMTVRTCDGQAAGSEIEIHGGRIESVREIGVPRGTEVRVERLFFNTPARRKFLRSDSTELSHALRWLTRYALGHPTLRFRLTHGERVSLEAPPSAGILERIAQVYGKDMADRLLPFELNAGSIVASGFAGRPVDGLPRRDTQHWFVNGRAVQDRVLSHAVSQAYGNTMPHGRHPAIFLFLQIESTTVDVNVHPQKTEVRFRESGAVHDLVRRAVASALSHPTAVPSLGDLRPGAPPEVEEVHRSMLRYVETREPAAGHGFAPPIGVGSAGETTPSEVSAGSPRSGTLDPDADQPRARPLAQLRESYIVAEDADGLLLVDQHAAHERVLFERFLAAAEQDRVETQKLLFPVTIDLAPDELAALEAEIAELRRLGFQVEPFGGSTVRLDGVPAVAASVAPEALLREVLGEAARTRSTTSDVGTLRHKLVTTASCHAAIKINHPLTSEKMQGLLNDLYRADNPTTCPHGRPILFRLSLDEIERAFRRK